MWRYQGRKRPPFAVEPGPGQESVWDYPRPPSAELCSRAIEVRAGDRLIACAERAWKIRETASPPTYYVPASAVGRELLVASPERSFCEWKGEARYRALAAEPRVAVAWSYPEPSKAFSMLADHFSFYPGRVECYLDGERVRAQAGGFYGGWITDDVVGPFKGDPDTGHW